jgi:hypothetical protein
MSSPLVNCGMKNLRLNYRYRDAHNYKEFGSVVFSNNTGLSIETATALLREKLISEEFFEERSISGL